MAKPCESNKIKQTALPRYNFRVSSLALLIAPRLAKVPPDLFAIDIMKCRLFELVGVWLCSQKLSIHLQAHPQNWNQKWERCVEGPKLKIGQVGNPFIQICPTSKVQIPHVETQQTCANLAPHAPPTAPPPLKYTMAFVQEDTQLKVRNSHFSWNKSLIWSIKLKNRVPLNCPKTTGSSPLSVCFPLKVIYQFMGKSPISRQTQLRSQDARRSSSPCSSLAHSSGDNEPKGIWRSYH